MGTPAVGTDAMVVAVDTHVVLVPTPGGTVPTPLPHVFSGTITSATSSTVRIGGKAAATLDSVARNKPPHVATPPGTTFQSPPSDEGTVTQASSTVTIGGKGVARVGDQVTTCNDPSDQPVGTLVGPVGTVMVG